MGAAADSRCSGWCSAEWLVVASPSPRGNWPHGRYWTRLSFFPERLSSLSHLWRHSQLRPRVPSSCSSSSSVSSSFWSSAFVAPVVWSCVVGWVVVVVKLGVVVRAGCWRLLFVKSLSIASHFELSSAVVSKVMSLVRSLSSLLDLSGCTQSSSHLLAGLPCFRCPFCLVGVKKHVDHQAPRVHVSETPRREIPLVSSLTDLSRRVPRAHNVCNL